MRRATGIIASFIASIAYLSSFAQADAPLKYAFGGADQAMYRIVVSMGLPESTQYYTVYVSFAPSKSDDNLSLGVRDAMRVTESENDNSQPPAFVPPAELFSVTADNAPLAISSFGKVVHVRAPLGAQLPAALG